MSFLACFTRQQHEYLGRHYRGGVLQGKSTSSPSKGKEMKIRYTLRGLITPI